MRAVLMGHAVDGTGSVLSVRADQLRSLLCAASRSGHRIVSLRDLLRKPACNGRELAISFDDGSRSLLLQAAPILAESKVPATLFLTTGRLGRDNSWPSQPASAPRLAMLDEREVRELHGQGWAIEAHSINHPDLRQLNDAELENELQGPMETIVRLVGEKPQIFAYPYGLHDARVMVAAARHYTYAVTTEFRLLSSPHTPYTVPRLDLFYLRSRLLHRFFGDNLIFISYLRTRRIFRQAARTWRR